MVCVHCVKYTYKKKKNLIRRNNRRWRESERILGYENKKKKDKHARVVDEAQLIIDRKIKN